MQASTGCGCDADGDGERLSSKPLYPAPSPGRVLDLYCLNGHVLDVVSGCEDGGRGVRRWMTDSTGVAEDRSHSHN